MTSEKQLTPIENYALREGEPTSAVIIDLNRYRLGSLRGADLPSQETVMPLAARSAKLPASSRISAALKHVETLPPTVGEQLKRYAARWLQFESGTGQKPPPQIQISIPGFPDQYIQAYYTGSLSWRDRHQDPFTGRWTSSILGTIPEMSLAQASAAHFKRHEEVALGISPGLGNRMTLDQAVAQLVFPNSERRGKKSLRDDRYRYPKHIKRLWGAKRLSELTEPVIRRGVEEIRRLEKPTTAERHVALGKGIFRDLVALRVMAHNPAAGIKMIRVENPVRVIPSEDQLAKLGQVLMSGEPDVYSDFFMGLIFTGARSGELRHALVSDLDVARRVLIVRETKSGQVEELHLGDGALTALTRRKAKATGRYLFGSPRGERPISYPRHAFLKLCQRAGVSGITLHAFRRGFGSACIEVPGATAHDASKLLRHASLSTTEKFYLVASNSRLQDAANGAGRLIARRLGLDPQGRPYLKPSVRSMVVPDLLQFVVV